MPTLTTTPTLSPLARATQPPSRIRFALLFALLLYLPQAFAVIIGVRIPFTPQDPIVPNATLSGRLQLYIQGASDPLPVALGTPKAVNLSAGQTFSVDVQQPTDPILPGDPVAPPQLYASFDGFVNTTTAEIPAALLPSDPILPPTAPPLGTQVLVGTLQAGVSANLPVVAWLASGPVVVGNTTTAISPEPAPVDRVLDDFKSGRLDQRSINCGLFDVTRGGTMLGGSRRMRMIVSNSTTSCNAANPLRQPATLEVINRTGPLIIGSGFKTFHRVELSWGQNLSNVTTPLNFDLTGGGQYDRIRLTFSGNDLVENVNLVAYTHLNEVTASIPACGINIQPGLGEFSIDFPLANLRANAGVPDFRDTDFLFLVLQSGSAIGANDLALKSMVLTRGGLPNVAACP